MVTLRKYLDPEAGIGRMSGRMARFMKSLFAAWLALAFAFGAAGTVQVPIEISVACTPPSDGCCENHTAKSHSGHAKSPCETCQMCCPVSCGIPAFSADSIAPPGLDAFRWASMDDQGPRRREPPPLPPPR